jgi:uncharacterized protein (TIGR02646 family)
MRQIIPYFDDIPSVMLERTYRNLLKTLMEKVARGEVIKTTVDIQGYAPAEVKAKLEEIFDEKCAFCEAKTKSGAHYDTEHFRPKSVYYWLAYEWSNFLLSCQRCNREYKLGRFPTEQLNARVPQVDFSYKTSVDAFYEACHIESPALQAENGLLLHPALNAPEAHLGVQRNGEIQARTRKGEVSIQFYGLSNWEKRSSLIYDRKAIIDATNYQVCRAVERYTKGLHKEILYDDLLDIQLNLLLAIQEGKKPFLMVRRACLEQFNTFFIAQFVGSTHESILLTVVQQIDKDLNPMNRSQ